VRLSSFEGAEIFDEINLSTTPVILNFSGTLLPAHYQILASTSLGAPNFPNGVNQFIASGSFEGFNFAVSVPEPNSFVIVAAIVTMLVRVRTRI